MISAFRLDVPALKRDFKVSAAATDEGTVLTLKPGRPEVEKQLSRMAITVNAKAQVQRIEIDETQGSRIAIVVQTATYDTAIPAERFKIPAATK